MYVSLIWKFGNFAVTLIRSKKENYHEILTSLANEISPRGNKSVHFFSSRCLCQKIVATACLD